MTPLMIVSFQPMIGTLGLLEILAAAVVFLLITIAILALIAYLLVRMAVAAGFSAKTMVSRILREKTLRIATAFVLTMVFGLMAFFMIFHVNSTSQEKQFAMSILGGLLAL